MAPDDGSHQLNPGSDERVSQSLQEAARLVHRLPDDDADKPALQRRLIAITASAKQDAARGRARLDRLDRFLEELRRRE
jgi:hypothetical protein